MVIDGEWGSQRQALEAVTSRTETLVRFAEKARDLDMEFLDREGEPMSPEEWIEARTDPVFLLVAVDRVQHLEVVTTWIGVHFDDNPNWQRVIFGTQIVFLHPRGHRATGRPSAGPRRVPVGGP